MGKSSLLDGEEAVLSDIREFVKAACIEHIANSCRRSKMNPWLREIWHQSDMEMDRIEVRTSATYTTSKASHTTGKR